MKRKEFVVFGVGDFGMYVAKTLANSGATVMVVDKDEERLEQIASEVTHTICADATNPEAVKQLELEIMTVRLSASDGVWRPVP